MIMIEIHHHQVFSIEFHEIKNRNEENEHNCYSENLKRLLFVDAVVCLFLVLSLTNFEIANDRMVLTLLLYSRTAAAVQHRCIYQHTGVRVCAYAICNYKYARRQKLRSNTNVDRCRNFVHFNLSTFHLTRVR